MSSIEPLAVLLPPLTYLAAFRWLLERTGCWRSSLLVAAIACGSLVTASTELLGLSDSLTWGRTASAWGLALLAVLLIGRRWPRLGTARGPGLVSRLRETDRSLACLVVATVALGGATGLIALLAPPNNWDGMAYHLPRVVQWMQQRNPGHFPTAYLPQLYQPPWSEFAILHLQLLSGGDRLSNAVQWLCMAGSLVGVSLIAEELGSDAPGQVLAVVVAATAPMGILQSTTTQNDWVAALWLVCLAWLVLRASVLDGTDERRDAVYAAGIGATLGLAVLTKGTSYIFAAPLVVYLAVTQFRRTGWRCLRGAVVVATVALLMNSGHYVRNVALFGTPLATGDERYSNEIYTLPVLASNVIRNLSLHAGTPSARVNRLIYEGVLEAHELLGLDASDPRTTDWGHFRITRTGTSEDSAGNPLHAALILACLAAVLMRPGLRARRPRLGTFALVVAAMFVLFCILLKWQPWHSRLQLPWFVLASPIVGTVLATVRGRLVPIGVAWGLLFASAPWVLLSEGRPVIALRHGNGHAQPTLLNSTRTDLYFTEDFRHLRSPYLSAAALVRAREPAEVGLWLPRNTCEYPLWVLLKPDGPASVRLQHVNVRNESRRLAARDDFAGFRPSVIIRVRNEPETAVQAFADGSGRYQLAWSADAVDVYLRK